MNIPEVLRALDAQISQLQHARQLLSASTSTPIQSKEPGKRRGRPPGTAKTVEVEAKPAGKRTMSEEGKARIAAAQKKRWARSKAARVAATPPVAAKKSTPPAKKAGPKNTVQAATPARTAAKKASAKKTAPPAKKSIAEAPRSVEHTGPEQSPELAETAEAAAAEA